MPPRLRRTLRAAWLRLLDRWLPQRPARRPRLSPLGPAADSLLESARDLLRGSPAALSALAALVVLLALAASDGGFFETTWYPGALFLIGLLFVLLVTLPLGARVPRPILVAVVALGGYAAWSCLSLAWADEGGVAWDGANRAALYAVVFALFALWPIREAPATILVGALGLGIAGIGLVELLRVNDSPGSGTYFIGGRLAEPVGYPSANAALWLLGFWPCVWLAGRREVLPALRGAFLAGAVLLGGLALMGQTRGVLFAVPVVAAVFLVLIGSGRLRAVATLLVVAAGTLVASGPALEVYDAFGDAEDLGPAMGDATRALVFSALGAGLVGALAGYADGRVTVSPQGARRMGVALVAAAALAGVGGLVVWAARESPVTTVADAWDEFTSAGSPRPGENRLTSLGSNRYDFWRVAFDNFEGHPLAGVGIDNFQQDYLARRRTSEEPRHPHSLELRVLSQTGLIGALLLGGALAAALAAAVGAVRRASGLGAAAAATATTVFAYWLVHGSIDWFWEFPGLAGPAFAMLGLAAALLPRGAGPEGAPAPRRAVGGWLRLVPAGLATGLLGLSVAAPWLAERHVERAAKIWPSKPAEAFERLERASDLNPLSSRPRLVAASIALRLGRIDVAEREFRAGLERDSRNHYAALELGAIASERGRREPALELLELAARLNPRDPITADALRRTRQGERVDVVALNRELLEEARRRLR